ncbi:MAG: DUF2851 family protein [Bacteroidales bacterium]|jgi:hypothetical protein|nr:DUF2851 family protein [Bacteroidales bacterium]
MDEKLLQYIWKHKLFVMSNLQTVSGENVSIMSVGFTNPDSGPDYINVRLKLNDTLWVGCVEIHLNSSDWDKHKHQQDEAYSNVILHVVYEHDKDIYTTAGKCLPTLELKPLINQKVIDIYRLYMNSSSDIPCQNQFDTVDAFRLFSWLDRLLIERLEERTQEIKRLLEKKVHNKEEVFYYYLAQAFGFKTNALPFSLLAESLPLIYLSKQKNNLFQLEAMLFGQADLLPTDDTDEYTDALRKEYTFLQKKFSLTPLCRASMWKFAKLYPSGFPTIRIAQFAALIHQSSALLSKALETDNIEGLTKLFTAKASDYWKSHYRFGKSSLKVTDKGLGEFAVHSLLINTALPFMYAYSQWEGNQVLQNKVISLYEQLPFETNGTVRKFIPLRSDFSNALHSQSLMQLYNKYCSSKQCLHCGIGISLISNVT